VKNKFLFFWMPFFLIVISLILPIYIGKSFNVNNRYEFNQFMINAIVDSWKGVGAFPTVSYDDVGFGIIFSLGQFLEWPVEGFYTFNGLTYPVFTIVFFLLFHLVSILVVFDVLKKSFPQKIIFFFLLLFLYAENYNFISYSSDVYLFPLYSFFWMLYLMDVIFNIDRIDWHKNIQLYLGCIMVGITEWFRTKSALPAMIFLGFIVFRNMKTKHFKTILLALFLVLSTTLAPRLIFSNSSHTVWHSIYTGLFQEGIVIYANQDYLPQGYILNQNYNHKVVKRYIGWFDEATYAFAKNKIKNVRLYSKEYNEILKNEIFRLFINNPIFFAKLLFKRLLDVFDLNPFKRHSTYSEVLPNHSTSLVFILLAAFSLIYQRKKLNTNFGTFFIITLFIMILPSLLVHSRFIMYSAPFQYLLLCAILYSSSDLIQKIIEKSKNKNGCNA